MIEGLLVALPATLREELFKSYNEVLRNYRERRWEPSELNGGKLCEVVYSIIAGHASGAMPTTATKPSNMVAACLALEKSDQQRFSRSVRIQIPRMLMALYEIRNNRGVGHVGGDVDPNFMDATAVLAMSKWLVAELVRLFHGVDTQDAENAVESIVERTIPVVWVVDDQIRLLNPSLSMTERTLLVLYHWRGWVEEGKIMSAVEHSNPSNFRRDVLKPCHRDKLLEYDGASRRAILSPLGIAQVERTLELELG